MKKLLVLILSFATIGQTQPTTHLLIGANGLQTAFSFNGCNPDNTPGGRIYINADGTLSYGVPTTVVLDYTKRLFSLVGKGISKAAHGSYNLVEKHCPQVITAAQDCKQAMYDGGKLVAEKMSNGIEASIETIKENPTETAVLSGFACLWAYCLYQHYKNSPKQDEDDTYKYCRGDLTQEDIDSIFERY